MGSRSVGISTLFYAIHLPHLANSNCCEMIKHHDMADPTLLISSTGSPIPQLVFGLYKVPANEEGEEIILDAVKVR